MSKISELSDGGVIQGGDTLIAVRSGGNVKVTYGGTTTANIDGGTIDNTVIGGTTPAAGNFTTGSFTGNVSFGDNDKAVFGASSDLQIYHDGLNSHITDAGTGNLILQATDFVLKSGGTGVYIEAASGVTRLYHSNALKLATTTTGIDVTGTVTADGLSVNSGATNQGAYFVSTDTGQTIALSDSASSNLLITDSNGLNILTNGDANSAGTNATRAARFKPNKDVEFYEDTGTTAKFFWDASAESLGIGTASPSDTLEVKASGNDDGIRLQSSGGTNLAWLHQQSTDAATLRMYDGGNLNVLIGSNANANSYFNTGGNVGIGTSSPDTELSIALASTNITTLGQKGGIQLKSDSSTIGNGGEITWQAGAGNSERWCAISGHIVSNDASGARGDLVFATKPTSSATTLTEAMRIDSSGNVLVGCTEYPDDTVNNTIGFGVASTGEAIAATNGHRAAVFKRMTSDGSLVEFYKDAASVGSIGAAGSRVYISGPSASLHSGLIFTDNGSEGIIAPSTKAGAIANGTTDLGYSGGRFKDLYLSGGAYIGGTATANHLDDYEVGTWTPTIVGSTSGSITGFTVNKAVYVKVGDLVTVGVYLANINMTASTCSGTIQLSNLPFTANSFTGVPLVSFCNMFAFDEADVSVSGYVSGTDILLHRGSSTTAITDSDEGTSTAASLMFSLTYEV